jgi:sphingomyelin phosphodiesterase
MLVVIKFVSMAAPQEAPSLVVAACQRFKLSNNCEASYGRQGLGSVLTQVLANADVGGYDGQVRLLWI